MVAKEFFIGIDVSKGHFDYVVQYKGLKVDSGKVRNDREHIEAFISGLSSLAGYSPAAAVFGMEHTGMYSNLLLEGLREMGNDTVHENASVIRNSLGMLRGKTDELDAERIARYLHRCREELRIWKPKMQVIERLRLLLAHRERLLNARNRLRVALSELSLFTDKELFDELHLYSDHCITAICKDLSGLESTIKKIWRGNNICALPMEQMLSVPGVGAITALSVLIKTNAFQDISDPKKFASLCGVAPFPHRSGRMVMKDRISKMGDHKLKGLLHICALSSIKNDGEFRQYFHRKKAEGKPGMLVLNAIRYKIILRMFACVNGNRLYISK
ncbi:IS110 family transposase [Pedobacter sp.]|uniref:IS110 family transposase n=1 Tax=Pedobacter sp. TaxID=1411316 RepID=UPI003BAC2229